MRNSLIIPANIDANYNCMLFQLSCTPIIYPYHINFLNQNPTPPDSLVKIEEDDSRRTAQLDLLLPKQPQPEKEEESIKQRGVRTVPECSKKQFRKDKRCPALECRRKYSSRIALRAHIRKQHPGWYDETSDYEP